MSQSISIDMTVKLPIPLSDRKTGTTIVSVPFSEGTIIATDLRATDMGSMEVVTCDSKVHLSQGGQFAIAGAGYSIGYQYCAREYFRFLYKSFQQFEYNPNNQKTLQALKSRLSNLNVRFLKYILPRDPLFSQILSGSRFLIGVKTDHFTGSWETQLMGQSQTHTSSEVLNPYAIDSRNVIGIGSGARHARGHLCSSHEHKRFEERTLEQALSAVLKALNSTTSRDLASSIQQGIAFTVLRAARPIQSYRWTPTARQAWEFDVPETFMRYVKRVSSFSQI